MHKHARLTPRGRETLIARLKCGERVSAVAEAMGISTTTVRKWHRRFQAEGNAGLVDRSSRPISSPRRLSVARRRRIEALRRQRRSGRSIAQTLGVSRATVSRVLCRAHLSRWRELEPAPPACRYEREQPGELIHLDIKKLGRIARPGHRVTHNRHVRGRGIGWEYVHVAIDDHSRVSCASVAVDEREATAVAFLKATVAFFAVRGITVQRVMTDNGSAYRSRAFAATCAALGVRHLFTKPYTPRTNGKAERFIQTALREWAYAVSYRNSDQRQCALGTWLHHYNWHRPHTALDSQPPISRLGLSRNNLLKLHS